MHELTGSGTRVRRWSLTFISGGFSVALALLMVLMLRGIAVQISPPPEPVSEPYPLVNTPELCAEAGGRWVENTAEADPTSTRPVAVYEKFVAYCQGPLAFEREREQQAEANQQASLFVFAIGGAIAVGGSLLVTQLKPVAPGLLLGGIVAFIIATVHIWTLAPGIGRLLTIIAIFVILLGIGVYTLREHTVEPPPTA